MIFFKSKKIKKLLEEYKSPEIKENDPKLISNIEEYGIEAIKILIEFFQQKKITPAKAQFLFEKLCDETCPEIIIPLIGDSYDEVRRVAKELIRKKWPQSSNSILLDLLDSTDIYTRNNSAELLKQFIDSKTEEELISKFNSANPELKKSIIKILSIYNSSKGNRLIVSALNDTDGHVRLLAVKEISKLKLTSSVDPLIEKLDEKEPQIRKYAIEALGNIGDKKATSPLLILLKDDDLLVRQKAVDALIEIADADCINELINLLKECDVNIRRCAVEVLKNMKDPKTSAALMQAIKDSDWWVRQIATDSLTNLKGGNIVAGFLGLTKDIDENIRRCAVDFFIQVPSPEAYDALVDLLNDPDWWVREKSIEALSKLKEPKAIKPILKLIEDQAVNKSIPAAMAEIGGDPGFSQLYTILHSATKSLRLQAMRVLVNTVGIECVEELKKCINDCDKEISTEAIIQLKELTGKTFSADDAYSSGPSLIQNVIAPGETITEAIVVIDLCNSTDIISRYGNSFAMNMLNKLSSIVTPYAKKECCQFNKGTGDGYLLTFPSAINAIRFSFGVLAHLDKDNKKNDTNKKINLRFAINLGETKVDEKGDRIGVAVNMAFRIEGLKPQDAMVVEGSIPLEKVPLENRIFVTENIQKEIDNIEKIQCSLVGLYELKGITGLHRIFHLTRL